MNKPPGHYRDERGNEYYWDGRQRSYIPDHSFGRFMRDMNKIGSIFIWAYVGVWVLPVVIFLLAIAVLAVIQAPALLLLIVVAVIVFFLVRWSFREREERPRARQGAEADHRQEPQRLRDSNERVRHLLLYCMAAMAVGLVIALLIALSISM